MREISFLYGGLYRSLFSAAYLVFKRSGQAFCFCAGGNMLFVRDDFLGFTSRNKNKEPISLLVLRERLRQEEQCGQRPTLTTCDTMIGMPDA
jgi:hypothetical protein